MKLHELKNSIGARKRRMRVGRGMGSGKGKTSGRGHKGQYARSGHKHKPGFEGGQMRIIRRLPKRGFKSIDPLAILPVNVGDLSLFKEGQEITLAVLRSAGLANGRCKGIKILGTGEIKLRLIVKATAFSATAKAKIEAAGGQCEIATQE